MDRAGSGTPNHIKSRTPKPATPLPHNPDASSSQQSPHSRPLNVTDALGYLDAVKVEFQDRPEVYNRFLDIMKDFKSGAIDTPGVIQRVSRLFHGNPDLIQGFNTFLPVGYRIDISADPMDHTITVTTPLGITVQSTDYAYIPNSARDLPPGPMNGLPYQVGPPQPMYAPLPFMGPGHSPQPDPNFSPGFQHPQTTAAAASYLGNLNGKNQVEKQPAGEFNHAIQFLNKIKARYSEDANVYQQFLNILQTHQKEQKHLQDSQIYVQVQHLFQDAPDLLAEFKDFLSDAASVSGVVLIPPHEIGPGVPIPPSSQQESYTVSRGDKTGKKQPPATKRKKRVPEKEPTPVPQGKATTSRTKKLKQHHKPDSEEPSFSPFVAPQSPPLPPIPNHGIQPPPLQHQISQPQLPLSFSYLAGTSADKLLFFDRAKRSLEGREVYGEFLKLLTLFSKEIVDTRTLVDRAKAFLGEGELLAEFKDLIAWDDRQDNVENGPPGSIRTGPPEALLALPVDDGEGPSYRRLPDSEIRLACSGRDELCRSVLNDEWVSHPTWASEEAGFVAHKKNSFEEALHKSEEERHEYHLHIESLTRTIAVLDPIQARIEDMSNEERSAFKLKADFGGSSRAIYHRVIKKVYGRESGSEIILALQESPSVAVPVVLARLKLKDEEWRRAQREWSRTWREVDSKNFYKSLDHQGITFKQNDKKCITAKHFVADIEAIKQAHAKSQEKECLPSFAQGLGTGQLDFALNEGSLQDCLKMVYSFLDRSQAQYTPLERKSVEKFLQTLVPALCMGDFGATCGGMPPEGMHDDDGPHEVNGQMDGSRSGRRSVGSTHCAQSAGVAASDLRKKLVRTQQEKAMGKERKSSSSVMHSRTVSPTPDSNSRPTHVPRSDSSNSSNNNETLKDTWIQHSAISNPPDATSEPDRAFFVNTTFYTMLRLLQLLYSRLLMCKEISAQLAAQKYTSLMPNKVAVELGLDDPNGPSAVLTQTVLRGDAAACDENVVYRYLLASCDRLFDGELDQATFEEHMRWFFGNKAYHLFTLDKLITALVKQVQIILSDNKCQELWSLLQNVTTMETMTNQDVVRYRREAEHHVGQDDHLYRLHWVRESNSIRVHLVGADDPSVVTDGTPLTRWREYVSTYVMTYPTEWVPTPKKESSSVFLRRTARLAEGSTASSNEAGMRIRIDWPSYKMWYASGTEDVMWRRWGASELSVLEERGRARHEERKRSRWVQ
ncbi:hypothetical protein BDN72DRAFT_753546 [Pluteus cervinus]|uniref:Uncharacterized protein n=1 Tax=Pluteus cervinus TaxID=181527 RepID=A0ACD3BHT7_9AGAR|nr:hypothetical protein BDN72DRAFT_753546 [Pluteus cervinus]